MPIPPIADRQMQTQSKFCLWNCLSPEAQAILRSHAKRGWKPPIERFVYISIGAITRAGEGDYRNTRPEAKPPADTYGRQTK
jgi:hypothetical protein